MQGKVPGLIRFLHATYGPLLLRHNRTRLINDLGVDLAKGPYLLLANHVHTYDPIVVSSAFPRHIRWVAGAYLFKLGLLRLILEKGATAIPKQQGRTNMSTIREMQKALKDGDVVGIFPEGTRTWDGDTIDFDYKALAKMVRIFSVPVVFLNLEGAYGRKPRWSDTERKGSCPFNVRVRATLSVEELKAMDLDTLSSTLEENLRFSNDEWKRTVDYHFTSPAMAEGLEKVLYLCPKCGELSTLETKGSTISCRNCEAKGELDEKDDIQGEDFPDTVRAWHVWEKARIAAFTSFGKEKGVLFQKGDTNDNGKLETLSEDIKVEMKDNIIFVEDTATGSLTPIPYEDIQFFVINAKQTMELITKECLYRIRLLPNGSSLKYLEHWEAKHNKES